MGPLQQRLLACIVYCLAVSALRALTVSVTCTGPVLTPTTCTATVLDTDLFADIQAAVAGLIGSGVNTMNFPAGAEYDFGVNSLVIYKPGVVLKSTGPGKVTFYSRDKLTTVQLPAGVAGCADLNAGIPLVQICPANGAQVVPPASPIVIDGIRFENRRAYPDNQLFGPQKGIEIFRYSGSSALPCTIQNCEFIRLWSPQPQSGFNVAGIGVEITTGGANANWLIQNNLFDGTRQGVYLNGNSGANNGISVINNQFFRFYAAFRMGKNDYTTDLKITGNTMTGGWTGTPGGTNPPVPGIIEGIAISGAASSTTQNKNWSIQNNKITDVNLAVEIRGTSGTYSWVGVDMSNNYIDATKCDNGCANVGYDPTESTTSPPPVMPDTWWGATPPNESKFTTTPKPTVTPWIVTWTGGNCPSGTGFCPADFIVNTDVVPDIISVTVNPTTVTAGQAFEIIVTLAAPVASGTLRFTSNPPGINCQTVQLTASDNVIRVPCTAPAATTAQAALAAQNVAAAASSPAPADTAAAAPGEVAVQKTESQVYAAAGQYNWRWSPVAGAPTKQYVITAIATADRTDTMTVTLSVCQNFPWPFRADTADCSGCAYNCATGVFSCTSCKCNCPKQEHPYEAPADKPYGDKPPYEGAESDGPAYGEEKKGYGDNEALYTPREEPPYGDRDGKQPYADRDDKPYSGPGREEHRYYEGRHGDDKGPYGDGKGPYDGQDGEGPYRREEKREYDDRAHGDKGHEGYQEAPYEHKAPYEEKPYAGGAHDSYREPHAEERRYDRHDADKGDRPYAEEPHGSEDKYLDRGDYKEMHHVDESHESYKKAPYEERPYAADKHGEGSYAERHHSDYSEDSGYSGRKAVDAPCPEKEEEQKAPYADKHDIKDEIQELYKDILTDIPYKADSADRVIVIHVPDSAVNDYAAGKDHYEEEGKYGAEKYRGHAGREASLDTVTVGEDDGASAKWLSALLKTKPQTADAPAMSALFEDTPQHLPANTPAVASAELKAVPAHGARAQAVAHTASLWHPMIGNYDALQIKEQLKPAPLPTAAAVPQDKGCGAESEKTCVCGPAPLTISSGCETVTYDPCSNTLKCSGGGYY